ncbi:cytochrome P450 2E1-like [Brevipalpus obovatus]|uniref:cytochrome P450 2E1-like n=1 Tax=Brevipalpus obovatus TaxID=246614 RepID=UPI003D9DD0B7
MTSLGWIQFVSQSGVLKFLISVLIGLLVIKLFKRIYEIFNLPPGPYGLPIMGYLPFMSENFARDFMEIGKKHGSPFSISLGRDDYIIINDWHHANEVFQRDELLARPPEGFGGGLFGEKGLGDMSGQDWKEQRRTALHILRDIGFGKSAMEDKIFEEIQIFVKELDKKKGKPFDISDLLSASTSNNISVFLYGRRYEYDDEEKVKQAYLRNKLREGVIFIGLGTIMPFLVKALSFLGNRKYKSFLDTIKKSLALDASQIRRHQNSNYDHVPDYIDGFFEKMEERKTRGLPLGTFRLPVLQANIYALFGAGSLTVFSTMSWMILLMVKHPHYQSRIREEISRVIGSRRPSYEDRLLMPFTFAFIYETLRYRTNIPVNFIRYATKDLYLDKTFVPKGTSVVVNFYAIDHDAKLWTEPDKFMPERLLSPDQSKVTIPPHLTPFAAGKRKCIGESMAMFELFQYLTSLIQSYNLKASEGPDKVSDDIRNGFISMPLHMPRIVLESVDHRLQAMTTR